MDDYVDLLPTKSRGRYVTVGIANTNISVDAWRAIGEPSHIVIRVGKRNPEEVRFVPVSSEQAGEPRVVMVSPDRKVSSRLNTYASQAGFATGRSYPAIVDNGALVIRLEREGQQPPA